MICLISFNSFSQVGIGTTTPDPSSILDIQSTTQGFLPPRMTTTELNAIISPAEGLLVFNTDYKCFQFFNGTNWSGCLSETPINKLDCSSSHANGSYLLNSPLNTNHTITIDVLVNKIDSYTIQTNTVNGYSFNASGTFSAIGINTITLNGTGTPLAIQTDTFTIDFVGTSFTCNIDINVSDTPLANCLEYLNSGSTTDGIYTVDPDGTGGNLPFDCYCDMTNDGGGWTLVFNHNTLGYIASTYFWANDAEANEFNVASPGLTTNKYSILSKLDDIKSNTAYEFRLYYPTLGLTNHWSQTFDPRSGGSPTSPVAGYTPININMTNNGWGGLESNSNNTFLDGTVNHVNWFYSIGSRSHYSNGIPANSGAVTQVQLFVR
ncbi:fibrinogen-like YCDxxxxGGGW domain-containing protein [Algibacter sp. L1A34]|uniref:fibrinogen-like YCDxxxxGGGW domain-containing protein n=1 Tax=Algibacter sp. L1A34 TaxID=2686365 RepID=UPI00131AF077|nr:fibrinogen-like YCDxxxxGGGW domain-containing protein [Algibacter sp. L1A34]